MTKDLPSCLSLAHGRNASLVAPCSCRLLAQNARHQGLFYFMNLLASPMSPLPPEDPPPLISDLRYIFSAASPACWIALCFESPEERLPAEDCWSEQNFQQGWSPPYDE